MDSNSGNHDCSHGDDREEIKINFHHPFTPYDIQTTFMQTVYDVLERGDGSVGILESPTGTGKSLSLICASLTWLREHKRRAFEERLDSSIQGLKEGDKAEPEWVIEHLRARQRREALFDREEMEKRLEKIRAREKQQKDRFLKGERNFKKRKLRNETEREAKHGEEEDDDQFALDDYESDTDKKPVASSAHSTPLNGLSAHTLALMEKAGMNLGVSVNGEEQEDFEDELKLRRVKIPPAFPPDYKLVSQLEDSVHIKTEEFKHLTLGSRKNLCINPSVSKLRSVTAINERCLVLQQPSTVSDKKCPYLPNKDNQPLLHDFRDHALATIRDIEDLGALGKEIGICPYYASRAAIYPTEIVTLPYPLLLQKSAREALGIDVSGHVVVVDEAHNLMDAISGIYSLSVTLGQLRKARAGLGVYLQKFRNRLKGKNRVYVAQVARLLDSLAGYLDGKASVPGESSEGIVDSRQLMAGKGVDQMNLFKLLKYLQESKLARKVENYIAYTEKEQQEQHAQQNGNHSIRGDIADVDSTIPTLQNVEALLAALANPTKEGRFFYATSPNSTDVTLKYLLLDPTQHFAEIVSTARAVILAGGTMSPMADYTSHLLSYIPIGKIKTLSCGHVIPKQNLLAWTLAKGPTGCEFEFTYGKRGGKEGEDLIDELGRAVLNICSIVPDGVVAFFPSYAYLEMTVKRWKNTITPGKQSIWDRLAMRKSLFRESKDPKAAGIGEDVLVEYCKAIDAGQGGLLLSVVGGKLSEGINFSDRLGRCVIIVGLPFPNIRSAEWKAKLEYIEAVTIEQLSREGVLGEEARSRGRNAGREFYENACMRAVNQSVGRAIRHRGDYAAIVMIDGRFGKERIRNKLPGWIRDGLVQESELKGFAEFMGKLSGFFREKRG